jgi:glucose/arabinose dehydrogenase
LWVYVANTDSNVRFPYRKGDLRAQDKADVVVPKLPSGGNYWTRDIAFSQDGTKMFVSTRGSNVERAGTFCVIGSGAIG